jgi:hypothetical protein
MRWSLRRLTTGSYPVAGQYSCGGAFQYVRGTPIVLPRFSRVTIMCPLLCLAVAIRAVLVPLVVHCCSRDKRPHVRVVRYGGFAVTRRVLGMRKVYVAEL